MAGTGNGVDFAYFRYTSDTGVHWSVKVDTDWGGNAASGLAAFNAADIRFPVGKIWRPRKVILQDLVSGRKTSRILGAVAATAGVPGATVATVARGVSGTYTLTSLGVVGERTPKTGVITHKPEPIAT
jgi:hypothetical protein